VKGLLQGAGRVAKGRKRGVHRQQRPRRPLPGMLLHIDGSEHRWHFLICWPSMRAKWFLGIGGNDPQAETVLDPTNLNAHIHRLRGKLGEARERIQRVPG